MQFKSMLAASAAAFLLSAGAASAVTITVTPSLAPNAYGSPSFSAWEANAIQGQLAGFSAYGDPSSPTYYRPQSNVESAETVVTPFASWRGVADPTGAFAGEGGNRMTFGLLIDGQGTQFSISQLSLVLDADDPDGYLDYDFGNGYQYGSGYWGINYGANGVLGGGDDTYITSGADTLLVDGLVGRGSGNSFAAECPTVGPCDHQAAIDDVADYLNQFGVVHYTGTYTLAGAGPQGANVTGSGTFTISAAPEPATWAIMLMGFGGLGALLRRRKAALA